MTTKFSKNNTTMNSAMLVKPNGQTAPGTGENGLPAKEGMTQVFNSNTNQYENVDAYLELQGVDGGLLFNRMTTAQMNALKAVDGMKVFVTDGETPGFWSYIENNWYQDPSAFDGTGTVTEVAGTTNQIVVTDGATKPVLSLDSTLILPGSITVPVGSTVKIDQILPVSSDKKLTIGDTDGTTITDINGNVNVNGQPLIQTIEALYPTNQIKVDSTSKEGTVYISMMPNCAFDGDITSTGQFIGNQSETPPKFNVSGSAPVSDNPAFIAYTGDFVSSDGGLYATNGPVYAGTDITTETGDIEAKLGKLTAGTDITAGGDITTSNGGVSGKTVSSTEGMTVGTGLTVTSGAITATNSDLTVKSITIGSGDKITSAVASITAADDSITISGTAQDVKISASGSGLGTVTSVGLETGSTAGLTITGSPITTSGTIDIDLSTNLENLSSLNKTGFIAQTSAAGIFANRSISAGTSGNITVSNGDGSTDNPTVDLSATIKGTIAWNGSTIAVPYGGTGATTFSNNQLLIGGGGSNPISSLTGGVTGTVLSGVTGNSPTFTSTPTVNQITINNAPQASTDGVNKAYADAITAGLNFKLACYVTTIGVDLGASYSNGTAGVGATLTKSGTLNALVLDGVSVTLNSRVLVRAQTIPSQNGIYSLTTVGTNSIPWVLTRTTDYDTGAQIFAGDIVAVSAGNSFGGSSWLETGNVTNVGTDPILYSPFTYSPSAFLQASNNLSDLKSVTTAQSNLGLTAIASQSVTQNDVLIGGPSNTIVSQALTNGQLLIGSTGQSPSATVPTDGTGITWSVGAGTLTANLTNTGVTGNTTYTSPTLTIDAQGRITSASNGTGPGVLTVTGTASEISVGGTTANPVLSIPATFTAPGSVTSTTGITAGTGLTVSAGDTKITTGNLVMGLNGIVETNNIQPISGTSTVTFNTGLTGNVGVSNIGIGVGTTTPQFALDLTSSASSSTAGVIRLQDVGTAPTIANVGNGYGALYAISRTNGSNLPVTSLNFVDGTTTNGNTYTMLGGVNNSGILQVSEQVSFIDGNLGVYGGASGTTFNVASSSNGSSNVYFSSNGTGNCTLTMNGQSGTGSSTLNVNSGTGSTGNANLNVISTSTNGNSNVNFISTGSGNTTLTLNAGATTTGGSSALDIYSGNGASGNVYLNMIANSTNGFAQTIINSNGSGANNFTLNAGTTGTSTLNVNSGTSTAGNAIVNIATTNNSGTAELNITSAGAQSYINLINTGSGPSSMYITGGTNAAGQFKITGSGSGASLLAIGSGSGVTGAVGLNLGGGATGIPNVNFTSSYGSVNLAPASRVDSSGTTRIGLSFADNQSTIYQLGVFVQKSSNVPATVTGKAPNTFSTGTAMLMNQSGSATLTGSGGSSTQGVSYLQTNDLIYFNGSNGGSLQSTSTLQQTANGWLLYWAPIINGSGSSLFTNTAYLNTTNITGITAKMPVDIICSSGALSSFWAITSSREIKDVKAYAEEYIDEIKDKFNSLKFSKYQYKDKIKKGNGTYYGVIAEEVKEVLPEAIVDDYKFVPNIMKRSMLTYHNEESQTIELGISDWDLDDSILSPGVKLQLMTFEKDDVEMTVISFEKGNVILKYNEEFKTSRDEIYIYGTYTYCPSVVKEQIFEMGMVLLQDILQENNKLKTQINDITNQLTEIKSLLNRNGIKT